MESLQVVSELFADHPEVPYYGFLRADLLANSGFENESLFQLNELECDYNLEGEESEMLAKMRVEVIEKLRKNDPNS